MRIVSFDDFRVGALRGGDIVDLSPAIPEVARLSPDERWPAVAGSFPALQAALERQIGEGPAIPAASVRLRAPVPRPPKLLCAIGNYGARPGPESPLQVDFAFKSPESVIGPGDSVV